MKKENGKIFNIKYKNKKLGIGSALISDPLIQDYFFRRSVILIIDYSEEEGALGLVLNKPIFVDINDVLKSVSCKPLPLYSGGPVAIDRVFFLHQLNNVISESEEIIKNVFWGGKEEDFSSFLNKPDYDETKIRPFLGYSSWTPGQLEREVSEGDWVVTEIKSSLVFQNNYESLWAEMVASLDEEHHVWLNFPTNPMMN
jgi:putative transcriptional regulator